MRVRKRGKFFISAVFFLPLIFLLCPAKLIAQTPKMDTILYGVSYYYEYMPSQLLTLAGWDVIIIEERQNL